MNTTEKCVIFCNMLTPYNEIYLLGKILLFLCDWDIEKRKFSLALDNASSNDISV